MSSHFNEKVVILWIHRIGSTPVGTRSTPVAGRIRSVLSRHESLAKSNWISHITVTEVEQDHPGLDDIFKRESRKIGTCSALVRSRRSGEDNFQLLHDTIRVQMFKPYKSIVFGDHMALRRMSGAK